MEEIWKDVKGFEGKYEVSNLGRVRSLKNNKGRARILVMVGTKTKDGYLRVGLRKDGKLKMYTVHRLVAMAFIPNPDGLPCVNHIDENKTNNIVTNLEWCSVAYNNTYGTHLERVAKALSKPVYQYTKSGEFVHSYPSATEAERQTGIWQGNLCTVANNSGLKSAGGYVWSFTLLVPKGKLF